MLAYSSGSQSVIEESQGRNLKTSYSTFDQGTHLMAKEKQQDPGGCACWPTGRLRSSLLYNSEPPV